MCCHGLCFPFQQHSVDVKENVEGETLLLRIPVEDKDLTNSPNWKSVFAITKGNEAGHFRIETDPDTNEGLLYLTKVIYLIYRVVPVIRLTGIPLQQFH